MAWYLIKHRDNFTLNFTLLTQMVVTVGKDGIFPYPKNTLRISTKRKLETWDIRGPIERTEIIKWERNLVMEF